MDSVYACGRTAVMAQIMMWCLKNSNNAKMLFCGVLCIAAYAQLYDKWYTRQGDRRCSS